jgi:hypothetical protein
MYLCAGRAEQLEPLGLAGTNLPRSALSSTTTRRPARARMRSGKPASPITADRQPFCVRAGRWW